MTTKKVYYSILIILIACVAVQSSTVSAFTHEYYFEKYDIQLVTNPLINTQYPYWAKPNPEQNIKDINYWVGTLPYEEDKNADAYIVYPEHGVTIPVIKPDKKDGARIAEGEPFNHYSYLEQGALHYYGKSPSQGDGNMVIAAHSSFKKDNPGRYNTVFQVLPISRMNDKILYYEKNYLGQYDLYEYTIMESYETDKYNVGILDASNPNKQYLTTYGCYVLGTNDNRRVNKAILTNSEKNMSLNERGMSSYEAVPITQEHGTAEEKSHNISIPDELIEQYQLLIEQLSFLIKIRVDNNTTSLQAIKETIIERVEKKQRSNITLTKKDYLLLMLSDSL